jgi:16S rRNA processing protein RimM
VGQAGLACGVRGGDAGPVSEKRLHLATVLGPHGVRGLVRLRVQAEDAALAQGWLFTGPTGEGRLRITLKGPHGRGAFLAAIQGVGDRDAAQALTGIQLYIPRAALPPAGEGEVYAADLADLPAVDATTGAPVGWVVGMANFGAGDLLEVAPESGGETFYVPLAPPFATVEEGHVVVAQWEAFAWA